MDRREVANVKIWVLMKGEFHEGGDLLGLYWTKGGAYDDFVEEASYMDSTFGIKNAWTDDDEAVHVHAGCDWLSLFPKEVKGDPGAFSEHFRALGGSAKALTEGM